MLDIAINTCSHHMQRTLASCIHCCHINTCMQQRLDCPRTTALSRLHEQSAPIVVSSIEVEGGVFAGLAAV